MILQIFFFINLESI